MQNGTGLLGDGSSTQGALIVPKPNHPNIYYIFTIRLGYHNHQGNDPTYWIDFYGSLRYSEVDITLNNGLGAVTENKNILLLDENPDLQYGNEEKLTSVHHSDGNSVWILARQDTSYKAFLITEAGISTDPFTSIVGDGIGNGPAGPMKFSPNGTKLVVTNPNNYGEASAVEIFNFDNTTGELTGPIVTIEDSQVTVAGFEEGAGVYGAEFSPNSQFLYVQTTLTNSVYQFNLSLPTERDILSSSTLLYRDLTPFPSFFYGRLNQLQVGSDGKVYMANIGYEKLHVINYPNNAGIACGFDSESTTGTINLGGRISYQSLPNFIQSYFESGILYEGGNCPTQNVTFSTLRIPGIQSIVWDFGDPASGADNASTDLEPVHAFTAGGTYTVTAIITSNGAQQTATTTVTILPAPVAVPPQGATLVQCADANGNAAFNLMQFNNTILDGQDANAYTVAYYASEADLFSNTPIANAANFTTTGQTVYAQVVNNATGCFASTSFTLVVNPMPVATAPGTVELCANTTGEAIFNLTQQDVVILGNQDPALFTVTYYANEQDVQNNIPITEPDAFASSGQTIYAVVNAIAGSNCTVGTQFNIIAVQPPVIAEVIEYTGCSPFNLTAIAAQEGESVTSTFYADESDALAGTNAITDVTHFIDADNEATLYIVAKNIQGCITTGILSLNPGNCTIPRGISPNNDGLNDRFDLSGFNVEQLSIFNRYGAEVFSLANYTDQWHGQTDNNNDLPTGTYYYSIKTNSGEQKTGWIYINREIN
jgi:gliding motility-associated-like protein